MNLAQALGVAAAAIVVCFSSAPAQTVASAALSRADIRGSVSELADMLERSYVFPDVAQQYATHLRARLAAGAYDADSDPQQLAAQLQTELRGIHQDAHLRITLTDATPSHGEGASPPEETFGDGRWIGDGVAYLRINMLPADQASIERMRTILNRFSAARALIFDLRTCRGGSLEVMDEIFAHLYPRETRLLNMDTRPGAHRGLEENFDATPSLRREAAPPNLLRWVHYARPTSPVSDLADARVFVLTDYTASACEHMALALKSTGRATLVGATTRGAGHYGTDVSFGGGRFEVFMPVGRTYVAATNWDWEGVGIAPDRAVAPADALNDVLRDLNVPQSSASNEVASAAAPAVRRAVEPAPRANGRRYGIGLQPPQGGEASVEVLELMSDQVAAQAGIHVGDRITTVNGTPIGQLTPQQFTSAMRSSPLALVVQRGQQQLTFQMSLD